MALLEFIFYKNLLIMEKINVAKLLKDCPKGMELDCAMFDNVTLSAVIDNRDNLFPIKIDIGANRYRYLTKTGGYDIVPESKCVIFPKGKTTWEGFVPPCGFKDGDEWNEKTKTLEKLTKLKFKIGDKIKQNASPTHFVIKNIEFDRYILHNGQFLRFRDEHIYELVPDKFDVLTLIPFESRVLVRHHKDNKWCGSFFSFIDRDIHSHCYKFVTTANKSYPMMIPYKGNEYLLGKVEDCKDFYKIWE